MRLSHVTQDRRTLPIPVSGETLTIVYRPSSLTPEQEDKLREQLADQRGGPALAALLAEMLVSWDLTDDSDTAYAVDEPTLRQLPTTFLATLATAITEDMRPNPTSAGISGAG